GTNYPRALSRTTRTRSFGYTNFVKSALNFHHRYKSRSHDGARVHARLSANGEELSRPLSERAPWMLQGDRFRLGLIFQRFGTAVQVDLNELHEAVHPRRSVFILRRTE